MTKIEKKDGTRPIPYDGKKTREELIEKTLKQLFRVRLAGLILCAAAAVGLYLHVPMTVVALVAAVVLVQLWRTLRDNPADVVRAEEDVFLDGDAMYDVYGSSF